MRTVEWHLETGFVGGDREGEVEVDDNATGEEIEGIVREEVFNYISWSWFFKDGEQQTPQASESANNG